MVYLAHIGSHLQYGKLLWGNGATNEQMNKLQKLQNQCLSYIFGNRITSTRVNKELNILSIKDVVELANLKFGYKLLHNLLPRRVAEACIRDSKKNCLLPKHSYNTRSRNIPNLPKKMKRSYKNCFLSHGPRSILTLNVETRMARNLHTFTLSCKCKLLEKY